jgi:hypothetical protein
VAKVARDGGDEQGGDRQCGGRGPLEDGRACCGAGEHRGDGAEAAVWLGSGSVGEPAVGGQPGEGQRQHGGGQVEDAQVADGAVLDAEGAGEDRDGGEAAVAGEGQHGGRGQHGDQADDDRFASEGDDQPAAGWGSGEGVREPAAGQRAEDEPGDRDHRGGCGQAGVGIRAEAQEHHVAGHVGDEHVAQSQVADGVNEAGDHGQGQEGCHGLPGAQGRGDSHRCSLRSKTILLVS